MNLIPIQIIMIPIIFSQKPNLIILVKGTNPEPKTMALGGVATGSMKAKLQPIALPKTGARGLIEAALEMAMMMGIIMFAEAVLEVTSVRKTLRVMERRVIRERLAVVPGEMKNLPIESARPVSNIWNPKDKPPPKRRRVPQSILKASFKERVNRPCLKLTGKIKRRLAPIIAAIDSGKCSWSQKERGDFFFKIEEIKLMRPGMVQSETVTEKAMRTFL